MVSIQSEQYARAFVARLFKGRRNHTGQPATQRLVTRKHLEQLLARAYFDGLTGQTSPPELL